MTRQTEKTIGELVERLVLEVNALAKYQRIAVKYGQDTEWDRAWVQAIDAAVDKVRRHQPANE